MHQHFYADRHDGRMAAVAQGEALRGEEEAARQHEPSKLFAGQLPAIHAPQKDWKDLQQL